MTSKRPTIPVMEEHHIDPAMVFRAQGCLLGQLAGDALGSMVEFQRPEDIRREYPDRIRKLADGGRWNTIAGQPTIFALNRCCGRPLVTLVEAVCFCRGNPARGSVGGVPDGKS